MICDLTDTDIWVESEQNWLPIGSHNRLLKHNLKMRSFLRALADGHVLEPEKLAEMSCKALEVPA